MARGFGFSTREEFQEYTCPGAYMLPRNPDVVYADAGWAGWDDWLGTPLRFDEARQVVQELGFPSPEAYVAYVCSGGKEDGVGTSSASASDWGLAKKRGGGVPCTRLPFKPEVVYRDAWKGWEDFLGLDA